MVNIDVRLDDKVLKEAKKAQEKYGEKVMQRAERDAAKKAKTALQKEYLQLLLRGRKRSFPTVLF